MVKLKGEIEGLKIWEERQIKWKKSLKKSYSKDSYPEKNSTSLSVIGDIITCLERNFKKNKEFIIDAIKYSKNDIEKFINYLHENKNIYSLMDISYIYKSRILQQYFKLDKNDIKKKIMEKYKIIHGKYGNIRYFNGHICRSNGEYQIAKKLKEFNILYIYEKKYPNSYFKCDFYLEDFDIYIEYMGFIKSDYMAKHNKKICDEYIEKYKIKKE